MLEIVPVPVLRDNYVWLVHDARLGRDGGGRSVRGRSGARGGGGAGLADHPDLEHPLAPRSHRRQRRDPAATGCTITGPAEAEKRVEARPARRRRRPRPDRRIEAEVIDIPAHTAGHVAFHLPRGGGRLRRRHLVRDGLRPAVRGRRPRRCTTTCSASPRCRRTRGSIAPTNIRCANGRFALTVEPDNPALVERMAEVEALRAQRRGDVPTTIALERATNPFMRARSVGGAGRSAAAREGRILVADRLEPAAGRQEPSPPACIGHRSWNSRSDAMPGLGPGTYVPGSWRGSALVERVEPLAVDLA